MSRVILLIDEWEPHQSFLSVLNTRMYKDCENLAEIIDTLKAKIRITKMLENYAKGTYFQRAISDANLSLHQVAIYGSTFSCLSTINSNLNIVFWLKQNTDENVEGRDIEVLKIFHSQLREKKIFAKIKGVDYVEAIDGPFSKFFFSNLEVNIRIYIGSNQPSFRVAAQNLSLYCRYDDRFHVVYMFVINLFKKIVESNKLIGKNLKRIIPNNYCIALLIAHAFHNMGLSPNFHKNKYQEYYNMSNLVEPSPLYTPAAMFYLFIYYYRNVVDLSRMVIDMGKGTWYRKTNKCFQGLLIIDPNDSLNPGRKLTHLNVFQSIIDQTYQRLRYPVWVSAFVNDLHRMQIDFSTRNSTNRNYTTIETGRRDSNNNVCD